MVRVPRLFHMRPHSLESLEAATAARPTFPRRCGVYRLRARHVAIGAPGSDGNKLTVVGVGWRLAHAREHLRLVAATELGMVAIDKWLVSSALWVGSALQLLYGRVQDACCSHLFDVLCCLHWTAHFPAFMAACGARAARRFSGWQRCEPSRCRLHRAVSYWKPSVWGVLAVSVLARGVSTGSEAWHVLVGYMERNDAAKNGVRRDR